MKFDDKKYGSGKFFFLQYFFFFKYSVKIVF